MSSEKPVDPRTIYRVITFSFACVLGFYGSLLFLLSWPAALFVGWVSYEIMSVRLHLQSATGYLLLSFCGIVVGQAPFMILCSSALMPFRWALLATVITGLLYLGGVAIAAIVTAIRRHPYDAATPGSGEHGSSAMPHKRNPTPDERRHDLKRVAIVSALCFVASPCLADVDILRHETVVRNDADSQLNHNWWIHDGDRIETQMYIFYDLERDTWNEFNLTCGPILRLKHMNIAFPVGARFHPEEGWALSHLISKVNVFGRVGDFPFFFINDLSWDVTDGRKNEHFLQWQLAWKPQDRRVGFGIQSDAFLIGSNDVSWTVGPVFKITYHRRSADNTNWDWTVDLYPFYDFTTDNYGARINFLTFRFGN